MIGQSEFFGSSCVCLHHGQSLASAFTMVKIDHLTAQVGTISEQNCPAGMLFASNHAEGNSRS
jgi:hypothetical protein